MQACYEEFLRKGFVSPNDPGVMGEDDSTSIQNAINLALESGVGRVEIPRYNQRTGQLQWVFTKTVLLRSNLQVVLDNCYLYMADGVYEGFFRTDNMFREKGLYRDEEYTNIHILGKGTAVLDGGKPNGLDESTQMKNGLPHVVVNTPILFFNVRYFSVKNLTIRNQRYWGMRFAFCKCGHVSDISLFAIRDRSNQDGINLRNGCHHVQIENVYGQTGDDMIALSAIDIAREDRFNMYDPDQCPDIHDVIVRNISGCALVHPLVTIRNHDGAKVYNILIENIQDTDPLEPWLVISTAEGEKLFHTMHIASITDPTVVREMGMFREFKYGLIRIGDAGYFKKKPSTMGDASKITIRNAVCSTSDRAIVVGCTIRDSRFSGIRASGDCRCILGTSPVDMDGGPGVQLENVILEDALLENVAIADSTVLDFCNQREGDYIRGLQLRDIRARKADHLMMVSGEVQVRLDNVVCEELQGQRIWCQNETDAVSITERE